MEVIVFLSMIISSFVSALITYWMAPGNKYCNSNYNRANEFSKLEIDYPEYEVHEICECPCSNRGPRIAKYVLWNFYLKRKNDVDNQELIIYDEIGKYNIGDKLTFTLK